jgi:hypothetical protein
MRAVTETAEITLDMETLTLGEVIAAEDASGKDIGVLLSKSGHRRVLALFVHRLRTSGEAPRWQELTDLRILDAFPGRSPSPQDSRSPRSNGSG